MGKEDQLANVSWRPVINDYPFHHRAQVDQRTFHSLSLGYSVRPLAIFSTSTSSLGYCCSGLPLTPNSSPTPPSSDRFIQKNNAPYLLVSEKTFLVSGFHLHVT